MKRKSIITSFVVILAVVAGAALWLRRPVLPTTAAQRTALCNAIEKTVRIEIHRYEQSTIVITNATEIRNLGLAMVSRWQMPYCLCKGMTDTWLIHESGHTNKANITSDHIKFGGPWTKDVVRDGWQTIPSAEITRLMTKYENRKNEDGAQP